MGCLRIQQRKPAQMGERMAAKSRGLSFACRFDAGYRVMLHHVSPCAHEQIERLGREIGFGHRSVELRLRGRLVASSEQMPGLRTLGGSEAFGLSGDFISRVKVAARAANILNLSCMILLQCLEHGGSRLRSFGSTGRVSAEHCRFLPELPNRSQIWSHLRPETTLPGAVPLIFTALSKGSEGSRRTPCDGEKRKRVRQPSSHGVRRLPPRAHSSAQSAAAT